MKDIVNKLMPEKNGYKYDYSMFWQKKSQKWEYDQTQYHLYGEK